MGEGIDTMARFHILWLDERLVVIIYRNYITSIALI